MCLFILYNWVFLNLGHVEDKYGLKLETCMDSVGDFKASGVFKHLLEGLYQLSGREMISSIMKKVKAICTCYDINTYSIFPDVLDPLLPSQVCLELSKY